MSFGVLTLPQKQNKLLVYFLLMWSFFGELMISLFGLPSSVRYLNDVVNVLLLVTCMMNSRRIRAILRHIRWYGVTLVMMAFVLYTTLDGMFQLVPLLQLLWAMRNNYRFFVFFVACVGLLDEEDVDRLFNWLCDLQWVNLALVLYEYFVLNKKGDYLGGLFGIDVGCNGYLNVYLCIITIYVVLKTLNQQKSMYYLAASVLVTMLIAALSELKVVFLEIVMIMGLAFLLTGQRKRLISVFLLVGLATAVGLIILWQLYPGHFAVITNLELLLAYSNMEQGGYHLSRAHAFSNINELFFNGSILRNLFGFGLGGCEYSAYSFLTSEFYRYYGKYNYRWFAHQMLFLETGYVGFGLFLLIFFFISLRAWRGIREKTGSAFWNQFTLILALVTVINLWYNSAIRMESGYLTYFAIAAGAVVEKRRHERKTAE